MAPHLLFDPDCGFCTRIAMWMRRWPLDVVIEPLSAEWLSDGRVDADRASREIPLVDDDHIAWGSDAFGQALRTGPLPVRALGTILLHPPVRPVAQVAYRWVAAHRHQLPGGTDSCRLPS